MDFNWWFNLLFTPFFLLFPLAATLVVRARPDGDPPKYRRRLVWLILATAMSLALFFGLRAAGVEIARHLWPLFFGLWFGLAMPAIMAKNPAWGPQIPPTKTTRSAALSNRPEDAPDLRWARWLAWATWGLVLGVVLLRLTRPLEEADAIRFGIALGAVVLLLGWLPLLIPFAARRIHEEPEPIDAGGSEALKQAYREHRRRKSIGMVLMLLSLLAILGLGMAAMAWVPAGGDLDGTLGWVLGGAGALIGLAGGVFGTWMSFERARIAGILRDLEAAEPAEGAGDA